MAVSTRENVVSGTTSQTIFPAFSREGIVATPALQAIRPGPAEEIVSPQLAVEPVISGEPDDQVTSVFAVQRVVAIASADGVRAKSICLRDVPNVCLWHKSEVPGTHWLGLPTAALPTIAPERRLTAPFQTRFRGRLNAYS